MRSSRSFSFRESEEAVLRWAVGVEREETAGTAERWERILCAVRRRVESFGRCRRAVRVR